MKRSFTGSADVNNDRGGESSEHEAIGESPGGGGDNSGDDAMVMSERVSVRCPLSHVSGVVCCCCCRLPFGCCGWLIAIVGEDVFPFIYSL